MAGSRVSPNLWVGPSGAQHRFIHTRYLDSKRNFTNEELRRPLFKYERGIVSGSEIRVLRIKPAERYRDNLDCTIEYYSLDDNPDFEALSYTWEKPFEHEKLGRKKPDLLRGPQLNYPRSYPLYIDGQLFWIKESLDDALRHIRGHAQYERNDLKIWVDAICIDQNNEPEKNHQVQQMRRVYSQASVVIIWLGPSANGSDIAMDALISMMRHALSKEAGVERVCPIDINEDANDEMVVASFEKMFGRTNEGEGEEREEIPDFPIEEVGSLLERAWWGRIWVLQELAVAKQVTFVCGQKVMSGNGDVTFGFFLHKVDDFVKRFGRPPRMVDHRPWTMLETRLYMTEMRRLMNSRLETIQDRVTDGSSWSNRDDDRSLLLELQERLSLKCLLVEAARASLQAKMGQDHIYALLGLASDSEELNVSIEYSLNYNEVFANITMTYLKKGDLWFLAYCDQNPSRVRPSSRSWIPDWTRPYGYETISSNRGFRRWNASNDRPASVEYVWEGEDEPPQLSLDGVLVDTIDWVSPKRPQTSQNGINVQSRATILAWVSGVLHPPLKYRGKMVKRSIQSWIARYTYHQNIPSALRKQGSWTNDWKHVCWSLVAGLSPLPSEDQTKERSERRVLTEKAMSTMLSPNQKSADEAMKHRVACYFHSMMNMTYERRAFRTVSGWVGLGSEHIEIGDEVAIFHGAQTPSVIRKTGLKDGRPTHKLVGEAYVDGIMNGELFDGNPKVESFLLE